MARTASTNLGYLALCFFLYGSPLSAAPILSLIQVGDNEASDENREYLIDRSFAADGVKGRIDVGDSFRGHINFNTLNSVGANVGGITGNNELSGVYQVMVTSKVDLGGGIFTFTFGPDPAFAAALEGMGTTGGAPMAVLYEDSTPDFASDFDNPGAPVGSPDDGTPGVTNPADVSVGPYATEEAFIGTATNGDRFMTLGFSGQAGEGFLAVSTSGDNVLDFFDIGSGSIAAFNNFSMSVLDGPGVEIADVLVFGPVISTFGNPNFVGFVGSQDLRGVENLQTAFEISTNTNVVFNVLAVPEPSSGLVFLTMFGVFGIGMIIRKRLFNR